jgi:superfamily II DNA or RNA helicase
MKALQHQLEILEKMEKNTKGKIIIPTGTGKTFIQGLDLAKQIEKTEGFNVYVVLAPRIMLSFQLLVEYQKTMYSKSIDAKYMCVHSGGSSEENDDMAILRKNKNIPYSNIMSTTSSSDIKSEIRKVKKQNKPLIIFSTYNSSERIVDSLGRQSINTTYCDEAHYLVRENFHMFLKKVKTERLFFFTATEKHSTSNEGFGMNNEDVYGDVLYFMSPRKAIEEGLMLRPRMQFIRTITNDYNLGEDLDKSFSNVVLQSFRQHGFALGVKQNPKLLVVVKTINDMVRFVDSQECVDLMRSGVYVFAVSSTENPGNWVNGKQMKREEFLDKLKKVGSDPTKRMIVLHYDILTEGIDTIFTGVLPFKGLGKLKFIQTYGRVARLEPEDRKRIISGEISVNDLNKMFKPYGWVIIPELLREDIDDNKNLENLVYQLRDHGFDPVDSLVISEIHGSGNAVVKGLEALNELKKTNSPFGVLMEQLQSKIESERIASLSDDDFLKEFAK